MPEARIKNAIAANAGFYTLPLWDLEYPYGLKHTPSTNNSIKIFQKHLIFLLGEKDDDPDLGTFRETLLVMQQGKHRLERGSYFYQKSSELSRQKSLAFNWKIDTVENVGHNYREVPSQAVRYITE